jgi:hypothetical protein
MCRKQARVWTGRPDEPQGFGNSAAGGVQRAAVGAYLARRLGGGGQEGAALLLGAVEAAAFGVEELHTLLGLVATDHPNSVSRRRQPATSQPEFLPCSHRQRGIVGGFLIQN